MSGYAPIRDLIEIITTLVDSRSGLAAKRTGFDPPTDVNKSWRWPREREALFMRTLDVLDELEDEDLRQEAREAIARLVIDHGLQGDSRVLCRLLERMWPF